MAKKPKLDQQNGTISTNGDGSALTATTVPTTPKKVTKSVKASAKSSAKKSSTKATAKKPSRRSGRKSGAYEPTDSEIRLRAYFIAERRTQLSLKGDPANDWLEARQQLLDEARQSEAS